MDSEPLGLDYSMITTVSVSKIPWSEYEDQQLRQMTVDGLNRREMSDKLHRSTAAIARRCFKLGLTRARGNHGLVQAAIAALEFKRVGPNCDTVLDKGHEQLEPQVTSMLAIINAPAPKRDKYSCGIMELTRTKCHWPCGDPQKPNFFYCGAPIEHTKPYCTKHCNKAYYGRVPPKLARAV